MKLIPWSAREPGTGLDEWVSRFLDSPASRLPEAFQRPLSPALNLGETDKEFRASIELPGMNPEDIEVQLIGNQMVISGERKWEEEKKEKDYYRVESQYGSFRRSFSLPEGVRAEPDAVQASYKKGVLEIRVPKVEPKPNAKIKVSTK